MFKNKSVSFFLGGGDNICIGIADEQLFLFFFFIANVKQEVYCGVAGQPTDPTGPVPAADTDAGPGRLQGKETASMCIVMVHLYLFWKSMKIMKVFQKYSFPLEVLDLSIIQFHI